MSEAIDNKRRTNHIPSFWGRNARNFSGVETLCVSLATRGHFIPDIVGVTAEGLCAAGDPGLEGASAAVDLST